MEKFNSNTKVWIGIIMAIGLFSCNNTSVSENDIVTPVEVVPDTIVAEVAPEPVIIIPDPIIPDPVIAKKNIVDVYTSQIGIREATGNNDGQDVEKYLKSVKLGKGYAWCAAFVHWCLIEAEIPNTITAWSPSAHNSKNVVYQGNKQIKEPQAGDVGTLYYPKLKRIGHTFFYDKRVNASIYESVEGNTNEAGSREGDGVYRKRRSFNATYSITRWE